MTRFIRVQKNTIFAFGEGETERIFLKYLRSKFSNEKTSVKVYDGGGKNPNYILEKAIRVRGDFKYNHSFILLDTDKNWSDSLKKKAREVKLELIGSIPCIEGLFLQILEPKNNFNLKSSGVCKSYFGKKYLKKTKVIESLDCEKFFTKSLLNKTKKDIKSLCRLIEILEGK